MDKAHRIVDDISRRKVKVIARHISGNHEWTLAEGSTWQSVLNQLQGQRPGLGEGAVVEITSRDQPLTVGELMDRLGMVQALVEDCSTTDAADALNSLICYLRDTRKVED